MNNLKVTPNLLFLDGRGDTRFFRVGMQEICAAGKIKKK